MTITPEIVDIKEGALIKAERLDPVAIFTGGGIDPILKEIERQVSGLEYDLETDKGRKEIASTAHKVSKSKVLLDGLGKNLVANWKGKAKKVDAVRKQTREFLDDLRDKVRKPLTEFEEAEKAKEAEKRRLVELEIEREEKEREEALAERERKIAEKEAEFERQENERLVKEREAQLKKEQAARDERLKKEAAEAARKEADAAIKTEKARVEKLKLDTELALKRAELDRTNAIAKAEADKQAAILLERKRAEDEAKRKEADRIAKEKIANDNLLLEKKKAEAFSANKNHQAKIVKEVLSCFVENGVEPDSAKTIVQLIATGKITHCKIIY